MNRSVTSIICCVATVLAVAGCGGSGSDSKAAGTGGGDAGVTLTHVDGVVSVAGDKLTVAPSSGAGQTFEIGPAVQRGELQALVAAGTKARVFYTSDATPIAARVEAAPKASAGAKTFDGDVTKVSSTSITLRGSDGSSRTFSIRDEDASAFDVAHLTEHRDAGEPVRVYYRSEGGTDYAVSYEDA